AAQGPAVLGRTQQGGSGDLRPQAIGLHRVAHVARPVSVARSDVLAKDTTVSGMELGHVLSAGHLAPRIPPHAAPRTAASAAGAGGPVDSSRRSCAGRAEYLANATNIVARSEGSNFVAEALRARIT